MKRIITQFKAMRERRQRGSIMILTAILLTGMLGILALSIDLGFVFSARNQFQNGVDAATLAAGAALRVTIEANTSAPQQAAIATDLAKFYASQNQVRRYPDPNQDSGQVNTNNIVLNDGDITIDTQISDLPRARVAASVRTPLLFGSLFGFGSMNIGAASTATLLPVDGGTGTMGAGTASGGGCWRPLFLPDTFRDSASNLHVVGELVNGVERDPQIQVGDYYRSRFGASARNAFPFVDSYAGTDLTVTGLRDTNSAAEVGVQTIMGRDVTFRRQYYFVANFSGLPRATADALSVGDLAGFGYCGKLRVGDDIPVYSINDATSYEQVRLGLQGLLYRTLDFDQVDFSLESQYHYVKSSTYPGPNTHGAIVPVLFYDPIIWQNSNLVTSATQLRITNIGLLFLKQVANNGDLTGYFVREIITGGTPITITNFQGDSEQFKRRWLPMAVQLIK